MCPSDSRDVPLVLVVDIFGTVIAAISFALPVIYVRMKVFKCILVVLFLLTVALPIVYSQENSTVPKRTPEQEASKQTDKLQQELNLSQSQANQVYEINLRYARERQISNKRSEALERTKNKNAEIKQVLSQEQNERLQTIRYERTYLEATILNRNQTNTSPAGSTNNYRSNQTVRAPVSTDMNIRNNFRPVNPNFRPRSLSVQSGRRNTTIIRTERAKPVRNYRTQAVPSYMSPKRAETSVTPSRK